MLEDTNSLDGAHFIELDIATIAGFLKFCKIVFCYDAMLAIYYIVYHVLSVENKAKRFVGITRIWFSKF